MILTGERSLNDIQEGVIEDDGSIVMTEVQRKKTIEILQYLKRQQTRRAEAIEFQAQMKRTLKLQQEAMEKAAAEDEISVMSDELAEESTCWDRFIHHCQNSSLFIFP